MTKREPEEQNFLVKDYFDDIAPSLLSSADIHRYAMKGWLVTTYDEKDEDRRLPAGYKFQFLGRLIRWSPTGDGKLKQLDEEVTKGDLVTLPANSITYLHMHDEFRLPQYVAARFNLRITHVHQGLLLGTGPMVDPGFHGRLLVPLHNLTGNDYVFTGGENFIHVEFTKLSPLQRWNKEEEPKKEYDDHYKEFDKKKITKTANFYFKKAGVEAKGGVVSNLMSLTTKVDSALIEFQSISKDVKESLRNFNLLGIGGIIALVILIMSAVTLIIQANTIKNEVYSVAVEAEAKLVEAKSLLAEISNDPSGQDVELIGGQQGNKRDGEDSEASSDNTEPEVELVESDDRLAPAEATVDELAPTDDSKDEGDSEE